MPVDPNEEPMPRPDLAPRRPAGPRPLLLAGIAAAVGLGLVFGLWARPNLPDRTPPPPMRAVRQTPLPVEVTKPVFTPPPESGDKLEVLPADLLRAAPQPPPPVATYDDPAPEPEPEAEPAPRYARLAPPPPRQDAWARDRAREPACRGGSAAEQLICEDPRLAAADRRLNQAYERALRSGVPPRELRDEQRDWLDIREDAARHSPRAVASVYEQRIAELNALADAGY